VGDFLGLLSAIDSLYARVIADSAAWGDQALGEWLEEVLGSLEPPVDRTLATGVRRAARCASRLANHWGDSRRAGKAPVAWQGAVDAALGSRGWEPSLTVARRGLEVEPSPELFEEVRRLHRMVHLQPWMEGTSYSQWLASQPRRRS
jgi:hypothetical protein